MQNAECRMKNEESHRPFSILHSKFEILHSSVFQPSSRKPRSLQPCPQNFSCSCCAVRVVQARTRKNKNAECRMQNEELREPPPLLNSSFEIRNSSFIGFPAILP